MYIADHKDHEEAGALIDFGVWNFGEQPETQIVSSGPQRIREDEVGSWKTFYFDEGVPLRPGRYLVSVGQGQEGQFVAFGNARATTGNQGGTWVRIARSSSPAGWSEWFQPTDAPISHECPTAHACAVMLRVFFDQ